VIVAPVNIGDTLAASKEGQRTGVMVDVVKVITGVLEVEKVG
jgi:hypothetical protein